ncbi:putative metabolite transport protein [Pullulanibacillus camelliae]|uniref:Putative metabolite transport protein n=1 Tax=Pullulanibacillus camelliae TaxID=1707096 RepID=A0A8J2VLM1_9BACL|nr:MFS transporter [Pullulanibacillus camelliae]GGE27562.1 putative metabolite transport protein [Pullulanibacillus camelliae]
MLKSAETSKKTFNDAGESLNSNHWKTMWASMIGYAMDGLDMMVLSFTLALITVSFHLNSAQAGFISTITLIGAVIGGYVFGIMADAFGRVKVFTWTILIFSLFTGLCALATNIYMLDTFRFIAGLGIGGEFGIGMTLVTEVWPKKYRSRATAGVAVGYQIGIVLATLCTTFISPIFGWRGVFLVGVIPALFAWWSRRGLKEPDMFIERQKQRKSKAVPIKQLFETPKKTGTTLGLILISGVQNFGFYGIMTWLPSMLSNQLGFSLSSTTLWTILTTIGMIVGIVIFGTMVDKLGRKPSYMIFQVCAAVIVWIFFQQSSVAILFALGAILGFFVNGMMGGYGALLAEHYKTEVRSTAENFIFNSGRAIGGFGPFIIGTLSLKYSLSYSLGLISGIYILAALAFLFLIPETKGVDLD